MHEPQSLYPYYLECHQRVSIDSRDVQEGGFFMSLKGPNFNGNQFAAEALNKGARYAVIDDPQYDDENDPRLLLVEDSLKALQQLAIHHRKTFSIPFIGLTGSSGKTTTKDLIKKVLEKKYQAAATEGNLNNHIGVPLTILRLPTNIEMAVIELAANHQKEIALLSEISMPTHGLITNVGAVHLEGFGGIEGVKKGKGELYDYLAKTKGVVFVNQQMEFLSTMASERNLEPIYYSDKSGFSTCEILRADPFVVFQDEMGKEVSTHLLGRYHIHNIATALCVGKYFGVPLKDANEAIASYKPYKNRAQLIHQGSNVVLLDAYNANLQTMEESIHTLKQMPAQKRIVVLGDMLELGDQTIPSHQKVVELTNDPAYVEVLYLGEHFKAQANLNPRARPFTHKEDLVAYLKNGKYEQTHFLIKGSRKFQLETLLTVL